MLQRRRLFTVNRPRIFEVDPQRSKCVTLLDFRAQNGGAIVDKAPTPKTFTQSGADGPTITTNRSRRGYGHSGYSSGIAAHLNTPDSADFNFGSGAFTIDVDCLLVNSGADREILAQKFTSPTNFWFLRLLSTGAVRLFAFISPTTITDITTTTVVPNLSSSRFGTITVRRNAAGLAEIAFDRVAQPVTGTNSAGAWPDAGGQFQVFNTYDASDAGVSGYVQSLRIWKGYAMPWSFDYRLRQRQPVPVI